MGAAQSTQDSGRPTPGTPMPASTPASPSLARAEAEAERLQAALTATVEAAQVATLFPVQKAALQCSLRCFDSAKGPDDLHAWCVLVSGGG